MDYTCDAFFLVIKWWLRMWGFYFFFASCHRSPPAPEGEATRRFGSELQTLPSEALSAGGVFLMNQIGFDS